MTDENVDIKEKNTFEYELNFANPEATMQNISEAARDICNKLFAENARLGSVEVDLKALEANVYTKARDGLVKPTESQVNAIVDADENVIRIRKAVANRKASVAALTKMFDVVHGDRRMFTAWYNSQNRVGMGDQL